MFGSRDCTVDLPALFYLGPCEKVSLFRSLSESLTEVLALSVDLLFWERLEKDTDLALYAFELLGC